MAVRAPPKRHTSVPWAPEPGSGCVLVTTSTSPARTVTDRLVTEAMVRTPPPNDRAVFTDSAAARAAPSSAMAVRADVLVREPGGPPAGAPKAAELSAPAAPA